MQSTEELRSRRFEVASLRRAIGGLVTLLVVMLPAVGGAQSGGVAPGERAETVAESVSPPPVETDESDVTDAQVAADGAIKDEVTVVAIRAADQAPVSKSDLDREEIESLSYGQDVPQLLQYTPSMNWYSDSGIGSNYSYFSLRGIQQTRINMTYDGAPLNDPAEHAVFFNNFSDFVNEVDSIQIQRGVGTSTVGAPAFGGSINFASAPVAVTSGGDVRLVLGSYDTGRASVSYGTGLLESGAWVSGRVSLSTTDGYRDHSGSEHRTLFLNGGWVGERSSLKFVSFSGHEESQLAYLAVEPEILAQDRRFNPLDEAEKDSFDQDFAQLKYSHLFVGGTLMTASLYYNGADGAFELWADPTSRTDLLKFGIDQSFMGSMVTASHAWKAVKTDFGIHYSDFAGDHTLDGFGQRFYRNTGFKQTANVFAKAEFQISKWQLFADLQGRWAEFAYVGAIELTPVDWAFFDPKIGFRRPLSSVLSVYGSIGRAQREPSRLDMLLGEDDATVPHDLDAVKPEEVLDLEIGINLSSRSFSLQTNLYAMEFKNEIALTGELSEVGLPLRRNVDESYRRGLEFDLRWQVAPHWTLLSSANLSRNRILEWTQYYDVYDATGRWVDSEPLTYFNTRPLLSPESLVNIGGEWTMDDLTIGAIGRFVGSGQLDNTGLEDFEIGSYFSLDLRASIGLGRFWRAGNPRIALFANNVLDSVDQYPSGYSYQFIQRDAAGMDRLDGVSYYYPLATRNLMVALELEL